MGGLSSSQFINQDRNSKNNRKMAKLMTAMSAVIPTNGYILYGDNNQDTPNGDHGHLLYDFYKFNIGTPTSTHIKVKNGVGVKRYAKGFIAYNITSRTQSIEFNSENQISIEPLSGLFCKNSGSIYQCLPNN